MNKTQLMDVTLRDGGHTNNYQFSPDVVKHIVSTLDQSGIGRIEIGYRNGLRKPIPNIGPAGLCSKEYLKSCRSWIQSAKLSVMCHPINIQEADLKEMKDCGVDSLRVCFVPKQDLAMSLHVLEMTKKQGFEVFFSVLSTSRYPPESLHQLILEIAKHEPNAIYLADSAGHFTPEKLHALFSILRSDCKLDFGFHAHDNLFLAQANALAAIHAGVKYIDASTAGLGRGVGNLRMEGIVNLFRSQGCMDYNVPKILSLADYVHLKVRKANAPLPLKAMVLGIFNLPSEDAAHLENTDDIEKYYSSAQEYAKKNHTNA